MKIQKGSKLVFIGDSITDCNRDKNGEQQGAGEGIWDACYGSGYVLLIKSALQAFCGGQAIRVVNKGISGHTVRDLKARWQRDVLDLKPDWLSVMIGINDVWRHFDCPLIADSQIGLEEYAQTYRDLLRQVRPSLQGLVLCSPYVIDSNPDDAMRQKMDQYRAAVKELAAGFDAVYVDMQQVYDEYLQTRHANTLAWDRIHPNMAGHLLMANRWLETLGYSSMKNGVPENPDPVRCVLEQDL